MHIDENSKLTELLAAYPWLPDELLRVEARAKPFLAMMQTPLGKRMLKNATVADAAKYLKRPVERLLTKLDGVIRGYESRQKEG